MKPPVSPDGESFLLPELDPSSDSGPFPGPSGSPVKGLAGAANLPYPTPMPIRVKLTFEGDPPKLARISVLHRGQPQAGESVARVGPDYRWDTGLKALCLLLVLVAQGGESISGKFGFALQNTLKEWGKPRGRVKWPGTLLGGGLAVSKLLVMDPKTGLVRLDQQELDPSDIEIIWAGRKLTQTTKRPEVEKLAELAIALAREPQKTPVSEPAAPAPVVSAYTNAELEVRLAEMFAAPDWHPRFLVAPAGSVTRISIPAARAAGFVTSELLKRLRLQDRVTFALSGGPAQLAMTKEIEDAEIQWNEVNGSHITFVALNGMAWPDCRAEQSAPSLALRLARAVGSNSVALVPPLPHCARLEQTFALQLADIDFTLLSGGAKEGSFVAQYLGTAKIPFPEGMVGDLAGHPLNARGEEILDPRVQEALSGFRCHPSLEELRRMAADPHRTVALLLGAWSQRNSPEENGRGGAAFPETSKAPLARACLAGRYANTLILPESLACELLRGGTADV